MALYLPVKWREPITISYLTYGLISDTAPRILFGLRARTFPYCCHLFLQADDEPRSVLERLLREA
jgi:hypothetical protein